MTTSPSNEDRRFKYAFSHSNAIVALCEDGTLWGWDKNRRIWIKFPQPPVKDEFSDPIVLGEEPPK